jgi:hypothetical protein
MPVHVFSSRPAPSPFEDSLLYANFLLTTSILSILECPVCYLRGWNYNLLLPSPGSKFVNVHGKSEISIRKPIILNQSNFDHRNWMQLRVAYCRPPFTGHRCHRPTRAPVPPVRPTCWLFTRASEMARYDLQSGLMCGAMAERSRKTLRQLPGRVPNVRRCQDHLSQKAGELGLGGCGYIGLQTISIMHFGSMTWLWLAVRYHKKEIIARKSTKPH